MALIRNVCEVRTATRADSADLKRLYRAFLAHLSPFEAVGNPTDKLLERVIYTWASIRLVAQKGNSIVGMALMDKDEVVVLFVRPEYRRQGIGRALLDAVEGDVSLSVGTWNTNAIEFYRQMGFKQGSRDTDGSLNYRRYASQKP